MHNIRCRVSLQDSERTSPAELEFSSHRLRMEVDLAVLCSRCGMKNNAKAQFCSRCGKSLGPGAPMLLENRYRIIRPVKTGGMGAVFKAEDTRLGTAVAIKKMLPPDDPLYSEQRFREEAKLLSKLHHGGLPKVTDFFIEKDPYTGEVTYYLVMTFIEGEDLQKMMDDRGGAPFPAAEAEHFFVQILTILSYLHGQSPPVIYRDLKPSNVMVNRGAVYLVDFGIAREFDPSRSKTIIGTSGYMAPEQWRGSAEPRSDLYSLGALMHYLLTGRDPAETNLQPFRFDDASSLNSSVPLHLDRAVMSLLEFDPDMRPSSAQEALQLLKAGRHGAGNASGRNGASDDRRRGRRSGRQNAGADSSQAPSGQSSAPPSDAKRPAQAPGSQFGNTASLQSEIFRAIEDRDAGKAAGLARQGIGISGRDDRGRTALHKAAFAGLSEVAEILLLQGADVDARDMDNNTPLHSASQEGHTAIAGLLIRKGADVNARVINGWTPLHLAASNGHLPIVRLLLENRADVDARNLNGKTALFWAAHKGHPAVAAMLRRAGAPE